MVTNGPNIYIADINVKFGQDVSFGILLKKNNDP